MKEKVRLEDYSELIQKALKKGILLNTKADKFNSMVIGWGAVGVIWGMESFTVYVRTGRYTREELDKNPEFTISIPLNGPDARITKVCGTMSGRNIDKVQEAGLTLEGPETNSVPGVREYPLTIECKVLYREVQDLKKYPPEVMPCYPQDVGSENPGANRDVHVMYIGKITDVYIIR